MRVHQCAVGKSDFNFPRSTYHRGSTCARSWLLMRNTNWSDSFRVIFLTFLDTTWRYVTVQIKFVVWRTVRVLRRARVMGGWRHSRIEVFNFGLRLQGIKTSKKSNIKIRVYIHLNNKSDFFNLCARIPENVSALIPNVRPSETFRKPVRTSCFRGRRQYCLCFANSRYFN